MKRFSAIFLFIFWALITSVLTAGLVFFQNNKDSKPNPGVLGKTEIKEQESAQGETVLSSSEVAKHNSSSDCWMIISGKIYNFTSYLSSHPGGSGTMFPYCGKDGSSAFLNKPHSQYAQSLLPSYYIGDLNSKIGGKTFAKIQSPVPSKPVQYIPPVATDLPVTSAPVQNPQSNGISLTASEVGKHSSSGDCWMIISDKVYNVTSYISSHPGGQGSITAYCGKDGTSAFYGQSHSQNAVNILASYYIGDLNSQINTQSSISNSQSIQSSPLPASQAPPQKTNEEDDD